MDLSAYFPEDQFGVITSAVPADTGLSGASVTFVETSKGSFVIRIINGDTLSYRPSLLRRASECGLTPRLVFADDEGRVSISEWLKGPPFASALSDPRQRALALDGVVDFLRRLHSAPVGDEGLAEVDPVSACQRSFAQQSGRLPGWASGLRERLEHYAAVVGADSRRSWSHNDFNPSNILWDGSRVWLVDWQDSGLTHPYYDLAVLTTFLTLPDEAVLGMLSRQEQTVLSDSEIETFWSLRQIATIFLACTFLGMCASVPETELAVTLTLGQCYGLMGSGQLQLRSQEGQSLFGLALLRQAVERAG